MYQRRTKRFRRRTNNRSHSQHSNGGVPRMRPNLFPNDQKRNNFRSTQSAEKLFEKYTSLAKEAISSGDKTLSENYLQHADHFMRMIEDRNRNQSQNKVENANKFDSVNKDSSKNLENSPDKSLVENSPDKSFIKDK